MQAYESSPERYPGSHPNEVRERCWMAESEIHQKYRPSNFEVWAYEDAAEAYQAYQRYGKFPYDGGRLDQPQLWLMAMDCMFAAVAEGQARAAWDGPPETE